MKSIYVAIYTLILFFAVGTSSCSDSGDDNNIADGDGKSGDGDMESLPSDSDDEEENGWKHH